MINKKFYFFIKRIFDFMLAAVGLFILAPFFILIAIAIKLDSKGPALYLQERVGRFGKNFLIFKFRTMIANADQKGTLITLNNDSRVTTVGFYLRKYKIDELPQLMNVLIGNMSFIGPRPEVKKYVDLYTPEQRKVLDYTPGITDPASLKYSNENALLTDKNDIEKIYVQTIMPDKIKMNIDYFNDANLIKDIRFILLTVIKII